MVVVVLPTKAEIIGVQPKYQVGDTVNVTCYSYRLVTETKPNRTEHNKKKKQKKPRPES